jgi:hypothetical protein
LKVPGFWLFSAKLKFLFLHDLTWV